MSFEPETGIGRVKELIWNAWPTGKPTFHGLDIFCILLMNGSDWQEEKPPAPSYLRVLYLGKMLLDDDTLASTPVTFIQFTLD